MLHLDRICKPSLLLDEERCRANIARMAERAAQAGARFRPHFKTHQSAEVGEWFRGPGVEAIAVSSVDMACYFAAQGWTDITIAFPLNLRQLPLVQDLASRIHLGVLVEAAEAVDALRSAVRADVDVWIKVDTGSHRTGLPSGRPDDIVALARRVSAPDDRLHLRGLLAHAGHTYAARGKAEVQALHLAALGDLWGVQAALRAAGLPAEISYGDTPACSLVDDLRGPDELRPGNFVFYDVTQLAIGSCREEDIAVAVACPVVALHPERNEAVLYGGAIHLSKEALALDGQTSYGLVAPLGPDGWGPHIPGATVRSLSQEHGVVRMPAEALNSLRIGDLVAVLPVHSCLAADLMPRYLTLDGRAIEMMGKDAC